MDSIPTGPGATALAKLRAREPFATILTYDLAARTDALDAAAQVLQRNGAHIVRVGNPLRTPLTLERLVIQLAGFQPGLGSDTDAIMRAVLNQMHAGRDRVVISVEQADTLHPLALLLLDQITLPRVPGGKAPQVLFTGTPAFARCLSHPMLDRMRAVLGMGSADPVTDPPADRPADPPVISIAAPAITAAPQPETQIAPLPADPPAVDQPLSSPTVLPVTPSLQAVRAVVLSADDARPRARPLTTARERAIFSPTRRRTGRSVLAALLVVLVLLIGAFGVVQFHVLPPAIEASITDHAGLAARWVTAQYEVVRVRVLSLMASP